MLTEIICILDRSGSMESIRDDAIGGFNSFIHDQKEIDESDARLSLVLFDDQYEMVYQSKTLEDVEELTRETFVPRGMTALLDAIGKTIVSMGEEFDKREEQDKPDKVICLILTDGAENSSHDWEPDKIKEMIKNQEKDWNWEFVFVSSDLESITQAKNIGICHTSNYDASGQGTRSALAYMSNYVSSSRKTK